MATLTRRREEKLSDEFIRLHKSLRESADNVLSVKTDVTVSASKFETFCNNMFETNSKQGENMSKLRSVTLTLVDNNSNLKVKDRIVFQLVNHVTEHDDQRTIQNVLITGDVAKALSEHNKKRTETVDKQILRNTGRDVMLDEVEIHDLEWQIVRVA